MPARTASRAFAEFLEPLQAVASCITHGPILHDCHHPADGKEHWLVFGGRDGIPLGRTRASLRLEINQRFRLVEADGKWRVTTTRYFYAVIGRDEREVLAYHWHPNVPSRAEPHLHLSAGAGALLPILNGAHLPTGRIAIEDVVWLALRELRGTPLRPDHLEVLDQGRRAFAANRQW